ncbi:MAG TPA: phage tail tape measure protein [Burkholderiales bacterium]|nr:phage tail tape measure protein [Burkholderiales bacterium]
MSALGKLVIELSADTVQFASDLGKAARLSEQRAQEISRALGVATGAFASLTAAAAALAKSAINDMDALNKMSQRVGVSVEALSSLRYAAQLADVNTEALGVGLRKLSVHMLDAQAGTGEAHEAFRALGVEVKNADGSLRGAHDVLRDVANRFAAMQDGATKTAFAVRLFGKSGSDLIPLLNQGAAGLDLAAKEAERFGLIVTAEAAKAAEEFNDNLTRLGRAASALGISLASPLLETLVSITNQLRDAATAAGGFWKALLDPGISGIADPGKKILELEGKLAKLKKLRDELSVPTLTNRLNDLVFGDVHDLNLQIAALEKQLAILRSMQDIKLERLAVESIHRAKAPPPRLPGGARKDAENLVGRAWAENQEEWNRIMSEAAAASDKFNATMRERAFFENMAWPGVESSEEFQRRLKALDELLELEERHMRLMAGFDETGKDLNETLKQQTDIARELGLSFSSAFEDAAIAGKRLSEVLKGLAQDVARIVFRRSVTEPLASAVSSFAGDLFKGFFSARAHGGAVAPGRGYVVGERGPELFVPSTAGEIVPAHELGATTIVNLAVNLTSLDPRGAAAVIAQNAPVVLDIVRREAHKRLRASPV